MFHRQIPQSASSRLAIVVALSLMLTASAPSADPPAPGEADPQARVDSEMKSLGVPAYPGLEYLCWNVADDFEHGIAIHETFFASRDEPQQVVEYYRTAIGDTGMQVDGSETYWRFPPESPRKLLIIRTVGASKQFGAGCTVPDGAKTVVVASSRSG